jgi:hypothetical protein
MVMLKAARRGPSQAQCSGLAHGTVPAAWAATGAPLRQHHVSDPSEAVLREHKPPVPRQRATVGPELFSDDLGCPCALRCSCPSPPRLPWRSGRIHRICLGPARCYFTVKQLSDLKEVVLKQQGGVAGIAMHNLKVMSLS